MELCAEVDPSLVIVNDSKWLSTYSNKLDPSPAVRETFPAFIDSKFDVKEENKMPSEFAHVAKEILDAGSPEGGRTGGMPALVIKDTGSHPEVEEKKKPDLILYIDTPEARKAYELSQDELDEAKVTLKERLEYLPNLGRAAWPHACLFVEFKAADEENPFEKQEDDEYMPRDTPDAMEARGQMYAYATAIMNAQPRTHVFFINIWRTQATLFYADHSQFVCTKPFNFTGKSSALSTFLYHLGQMNREELGYDSSVTAATAEDIAAVNDVKAEMTPYHQDCVADAFFESGWPVYRVTMPAEQAGFKQPWEDGDFLIGRPLYKIYSPTSRTTKVYAAYNMTTERMCTVKDCWPEEWEDGEHTTYKCIQEAEVRYTATCLYGGYVGEQKTKTCGDLEHTRPIRRHYRIVLKELARPLDSYESSGELIVAGWCVLTAHREAWEKCGLLHRDMSPGNMVFDEVDPRDRPKDEPRRIQALLIDWHLAKSKDELKSGAKRGTWQFISARLLRNPTAQNEVSDDLESVILIMEWMSLRFHDHQCEMDRVGWLKEHVLKFFEFRAYDFGNHHVGGEEKYKQWMYGSRDWQPKNTMSVFENLLDSLLQLAHNHYLALKARAPQPAPPAKPTFELHFTAALPKKLAKKPRPQPGPSATVKTTDTGTLSLATHAEIITTFREAMESLSKGFVRDKVSDKFESIGMATEKFSLAENAKRSKQSKKQATSEQQEKRLRRTRSLHLSAQASTEGEQAEGLSKPVKRRLDQMEGLEEKDGAKRQATGTTRSGSHLRNPTT
ncbi:uncharacterized protein LAESUDRAFT_761494 [Laetiporus sulphureus 93-53]|uniref:Fungal-type protein kinase domain-containing protein n=1 Tax=Laetiporus sulphureus 93-53 TaxID=1314785 RepID=A0A165D0K3_9APHY|nr:uncharacterized protein LAESUDRAFT_761494 [Laetiporus sulphureus 93-53]KZT03893.1 hypothetical protein LAESUDRAFT_761494 [Laetiporus sulphureus 93-53]